METIESKAAKLSDIIAARKERLAVEVCALYSLRDAVDIRARVTMVSQGPVKPDELERFWVEVDGKRVTEIWAAGFSEDGKSAGVGIVEGAPT